jgi:hypothetical protein
MDPMSLSDWITGKALANPATAIPAIPATEGAQPLSTRQQGLIAVWLTLELWTDDDIRDVLAQCRKDPTQAAYYLERAQAFDVQRQRACYPAMQRPPIQPGTIQRVTIAHDDWCDLLNGRGPCNCDPDIGLPEVIGLRELRP